MKTLKFNYFKSNNKKGFTIIEVVLVLAIAGLIFLMVFLALPALQRSQRDAQRRQHAALVVEATNRWLQNNPRANMTRGNDVVRFDKDMDISSWRKQSEGSYFPERIEDPIGRNYRISYGRRINYRGEAGRCSKDTPKNGDCYDYSYSTFDKYKSLTFISVSFGYRCNPENPNQILYTSAGNRPFAVSLPLESGGRYCIDT